MFEGIGQPLVRKLQPRFSSENPYWHRWTIKGVFPEYQPRPTAHDFLYASTWELWRWDLHGAFCVRMATVLTARLNFRISLVNQLKGASL